MNQIPEISFFSTSIMDILVSTTREFFFSCFCSLVFVLFFRGLASRFSQWVSEWLSISSALWLWKCDWPSCRAGRYGLCRFVVFSGARISCSLLLNSVCRLLGVLNNVPDASLTKDVIMNRCWGKFMDEWNYLRAQATGPLNTFMNFISYGFPSVLFSRQSFSFHLLLFSLSFYCLSSEYMIENINHVIGGILLGGIPVKQLIAQSTEPLGYFPQMESMAAIEATEPGEFPLYFFAWEIRRWRKRIGARFIANRFHQDLLSFSFSVISWSFQLVPSFSPFISSFGSLSILCFQHLVL